jgi:glutathione S-transferase
MQITLYYAPIACSLVPYVTLTEANAEFDVRPINIRKKHHMSAEYLVLNPKHKIPLLIVDGQTLSENVAINLWISRTFPQANLLPSDPWDEAQAVSLLAWCASGIHPHLSRYNSPSKFCDVPGTEASVREIARQSLFDSFGIADKTLAGREYFFEHFTSADAYFF